jgi:hypothetical protein
MAASALYLLPDATEQRDAFARQARVWEPAGRVLLDDLARDLRPGPRTLRIGPGDDLDALASGGEHAYDIVHARFHLALHGCAPERIAALRALVAPGGALVLEEPDTRSLTFAPIAPAATHLVGRVAQAMKAAGADLDAGRRLPRLMGDAGLRPRVRTHVMGFEAGHPFLRLPLDLADAYAGRLADILGGDGLVALRREAARELADPERSGTTFTLVQAWARV